MVTGRGGGGWELPRKRQGQERPGARHAHRAAKTETTDVIHTTRAGLQGEDPHRPLEGQEGAPRRHRQPSGSLDSDNTVAVPRSTGAPTTHGGSRATRAPDTLSRPHLHFSQRRENAGTQLLAARRP